MTDHVLELHTDAQGVDYYSHLLDRVKKTVRDPNDLYFSFSMTRAEVEEIGQVTFSDEQWEVFKQNLSVEYFDSLLSDHVSDLIFKHKRGDFS